MPGYLSASSEFVVNTLTVSHQDQPRVAHFSNGNYVVVWSTYDSANPDNIGTIKAQLFDSLGNRIGGEFQVNSFDYSWQSAPEVTVLADNSFVVVWQTDDTGRDGWGRAVVAQRFDANGAALGSEFVVNTSSAGFQSTPHLTALAGGGFVVAWDDSYTHTVRAQTYAADGTTVGGETVIANYNATYNTMFDLQPQANGGYVVSWTTSTATGNDVRAQFVAANGTLSGPAFAVNNLTAGNQEAPHIVVLANGNFLIAWTTYDTTQDGSNTAIKAQLFDAAGNALGSEFLVNQATAGYQYSPQLSALPDGGFIAVWSTWPVAGSWDNSLVARTFDAAGQPTGNEFQVNSYAPDTQYLGGITTLPDGRVLVTFSSYGAEGLVNDSGILIHTLAPAGPNMVAPSIISNGGGASAAVTVAEYSSLATNLQAFDPDGPQATTFSITGGADAARFAIHPTTGRLTFVSTPEFANPTDADGDNVYEVVVTASDGSLTDSQVLQVTVQDVDETVSFSGPTQFQLNENEQVAGSAAASSAATLPIYYQIVGGDDAAFLSIDPFTGTLYFNNAPDFENPGDANGDNVYDVLVMASNGVASATAAFVVQVQDVMDDSIFVSSDNVAVTENNDFVVTVQAVSPTESFLYAITGGEDAGLFQIDQQTGELHFIAAPDYDAPLDLQGDNVYQVEVSAWGQSTGTTATQLISVAVQNVDEAPIFLSTQYPIVNENQTSVLQVQAYDPEGGGIVYAIYQMPGVVDDSVYFTIDPNTGQLSFIGAPDFEAPNDLDGDNMYQIFVSALDLQGNWLAVNAMTIEVANVNEAPVITSNGAGASAALSIGENGTAVTTVTSTDPEGAARTYTITGGADAALFTIDAASGALAFISAPNFEVPQDANGDNAYVVTVRASDGTLGDTQVITVTVTNVNEGPSITSGGSFAIAENGTAVATLAASDPEATALTWSIAGGADAALFTIDAVTGALSFISAPNYEAPGDAGADNVYDVIVSASDGLLAATQAIAVAVSNGNEGQLVAPGQGFAASENSIAAGTFAATDLDGDALTYAISGGADASRFTINSITGAVSFVTAPDFEAPSDSNGDNVYDLVITASDGSIATQGTFTVTVGNVNEAPVITGSASLTASEGSTAVATLSASDPENNNPTWSISGGADAARFTINAATGALSFVTTPDFEAPTDSDGDNQYLVHVTVSDGSLTASQLFTINLGNVNEAPLITSNGGGASAAIAVSENSATVTTVTSTDPEGTARTYSIVGGADAARFSINAATGALTFIAPPNYEAPTDAGGNNVYDVIVQASDGFLTDTQALAITVGNVNEAPVITSNGGGDTASVTINENTSAVLTVTSTDPEGTARTYSIVGGNDAARFTINPTTGALSFIAAPNWELPTDSNADNIYNVIVAASDGSLTDTQALAVTVGNVVDGSTINGTNSANTLTGTTAEDTINGLGGNDTITGGLGADVLTGGSGADRFVYSSINDSSLSAPDRITDFTLSQNDRISLSGIDANTGLAGDQAFSWIGTGNFTNVAGQLRYYQSGGNTYVTGDVNGDGVGDFLIRIDPAVTLSASYFIL